MSGWAGGIANRTWQRDRRGPDSGRLDAVSEVRHVLSQWRAAHGWEPGMVWNPYQGAYEHAGPDPVIAFPERIRAERARQAQAQRAARGKRAAAQTYLGHRRNP